jgi:hypothetical protein
MEGKKKVFVLQDTKEPFFLLAISCAESIHKLVWLIQSQLEITFAESSGLRVIVSGKEPIEFPVHKGISPVTGEEFSLIKNKIHSSILLKSQPNIDYILKVSGTNSPIRVKEVIASVKKVPGVLAALRLEIQKGKGFAAFDLV